MMTWRPSGREDVPCENDKIRSLSPTPEQYGPRLMGYADPVSKIIQRLLFRRE